MAGKVHRTRHAHVEGNDEIPLLERRCLGIAHKKHVQIVEFTHQLTKMRNLRDHMESDHEFMTNFQNFFQM
jgi:hypothetical protein